MVLVEGGEAPFKCEKEDAGRRREAESLNTASLLFPAIFPVAWDGRGPVTRPGGGVGAGGQVAK